MPRHPATPARRLIQADGIVFERQGEAIFDSIDLTIESGQLLLILGPNGSGKTTLLRCLAGAIRPHRGTIEGIDDRALLGHRTGLKDDLNCRENLRFVQRFFGSQGNDPGPDQALAQVGLAGLGLRPARSLSAGQKRRLGLASLLVAHRSLWLLDEPYASLDDEGGAVVDRLLTGHLARGGGIALSTHQRMPDIANRDGDEAVTPAIQQLRLANPPRRGAA